MRENDSNIFLYCMSVGIFPDANGLLTLKCDLSEYQTYSFAMYILVNYKNVKDEKTK